MAPLSPSNTLRYFADYSVGTVEHTAVIRANAVLSPATMGTQLDQVFTALAGQLSSISFVRLRVAVVGSNVTNPVICGIEGNTYGAGVAGTLEKATSLNFVGRSTAGRRSRFSIFGYKGAPSDFRLTSAEAAAIGTALLTINGGVNSWLAIDGLKAVWYPYADVSYNAYWQRQLRA